MSEVAGLVLAAGAGSRFGRPKAVVELDGERLFTYHVHEQALRRRLAAAQSPR